MHFLQVVKLKLFCEFCKSKQFHVHNSCKTHKSTEEANQILVYRKVASSTTSHFEAHAGFSRSLMKEIFDPYVLWPFDKKMIS